MNLILFNYYFIMILCFQGQIITGLITHVINNKEIYVATARYQHYIRQHMKNFKACHMFIYANKYNARDLPKNEIDNNIFVVENCLNFYRAKCICL